MQMRNYLLVAALAAITNAVEVEEIVANADFTQANCDITNEFYVQTLPGFTGTSDEWPCSYAGTVSSNENGSH